MKGRRQTKNTVPPAVPSQFDHWKYNSRDSDASYASRASSIGMTRSSIVPSTTDRSYQTSALRTINAYLSSHSLPFHLKPPLPSTREINETFKFLMSRLHYESQKLDEDLPIILHHLSCPFPLKTSLLKNPSVPHAWPQLLPIIHWLAELARYSDHLAASPVTFFPSPGNDLLKYSITAYSHFIRGEDDAVVELDHECIENLQMQSTAASDQVGSLSQSAEDLEKQVHIIRSTPSPKQKLENERSALLEDEKKFVAIIESYTKRVDGLEKDLKDKEKESEVKEMEKLRIFEENEVLRKRIESQGVDVRDAERMRREMQAVEREIDEARDGRDMWEGKVLDLDAALRHKLKELESVSDDCNQVIRRLKLKDDFQYVLNPKGSTPTEVLGIDYKAKLGPALDSLADNIQKNKLAKSGELISLEQQLQEHEKKLSAKREHLAILQSKIDETEDQTDLLKKEIEDHASSCAMESEQQRKHIERDLHNLQEMEREAEEYVKGCRLKLQETIRQNDEEVQLCAHELFALMDSVTKYKEYMESLISSMRTELSETARSIAEAHKTSLTAKLEITGS